MSNWKELVHNSILNFNNRGKENEIKKANLDNKKLTINEKIIQPVLREIENTFQIEKVPSPFRDKKLNCVGYGQKENPFLKFTLHFDYDQIKYEYIKGQYIKNGTFDVNSTKEDILVEFATLMYESSK